MTLNCVEGGEVCLPLRSYGSEPIASLVFIRTNTSSVAVQKHSGPIQ